jgi:hypothetical protein
MKFLPIEQGGSLNDSGFEIIQDDRLGTFP